MLVRVIANAFRRQPAPRAATAVAAISAAPAPASAAQDAVSILERQLVQMCQAGQTAEALVAFGARVPHPASPQEALSLLTRLASPVLSACRRHGDANSACALEFSAYDRLIKKFEDPAHYEACFSRMDTDLHSLGVHDAVAPENAEAENDLLFFLHNLGNDFAHLELLCDLVDAYLTARPQNASKIGFTGAYGAQPSPRVVRLQAKWGVRVWPISWKLPIQQVYLSAARNLAEGRYRSLVVVAAPLGITYLSGVVGERLTWLSMKFELGCFEHLAHRCSFVSGVRRTRIVASRRWHEAPPLFTDRKGLKASGASLAVLISARSFGTVFYTVNREEKIRNPLFLEAVTRILQAVPESAFVWTGRRALPDIERWFAEHGLSHRHFFAGWVEPDDLVLGGDIFLDTPVLSGTVAARAVANARPVVTLVDSHSWINFFWPAYALDRGSVDAAELDAAVARLAEERLTVQCETIDAYVEQAVLLARQPELRKAYGSLLGEFAQRYFFNAERSALAHFRNLNGESNDE